MAYSLTIRRMLSASPQEVFAAWTDPASFCQWMCPPGTDPNAARADVRVGGSFYIVMHHQGRDYEHRGVYRIVDPPSKLAFTWISEGTDNQETLVTIEITAHGDQSELVLTHEGIPQADRAADHKQGWAAMADNLAQYVAKRGRSSTITP